MTSTGTFLAVLLGNSTGPKRQAWDALPQEQRRAKEQEGFAAWKAWMAKHEAVLVAGVGGPLGKTKRADPHGIEDVSNEMSGFLLVRADSHEAAAKLFENHPHFTVFPGEAVDIMPVLAIPGM